MMSDVHSHRRANDIIGRNWAATSREVGPCRRRVGGCDVPVREMDGEGEGDGERVGWAVAKWNVADGKVGSDLTRQM